MCLFNVLLGCSVCGCLSCRFVFFFFFLFGVLCCLMRCSIVAFLCCLRLPFSSVLVCCRLFDLSVGVGVVFVLVYCVFGVMCVVLFLVGGLVYSMFGCYVCLLFDLVVGASAAFPVHCFLFVLCVVLFDAVFVCCRSVLPFFACFLCGCFACCF